MLLLRSLRKNKRDGYEEYFRGTDWCKTMGIAGHIRPDGDCVGSCMALYLYVTEHFPEIDVRIYLDHPKPVFSHIDRIGDIRTETDGDREFDLFVTCDVSARDRLAVADEYFDRAKRRCALIIMSAIRDLRTSIM